MSAEIVERVLRSARYRDIDRSMLERFADQEFARARNADDAVKRVKRRLHQAVGAFRGATRPGAMAAAWSGDLAATAFRAACAEALRAHASTRERLDSLDTFYNGIWSLTGVPSRLLDLGCGLNPLTLPWMGLPPEATYLASDVDRRPLATVASFLELVRQPHEVEVLDVLEGPPDHAADVALMLKLVTTLDRQSPEASANLLRALRVRHALVSFPRQSLGGRGKGMDRTYRERLDRLVADAGRVTGVAEASVPSELVFVLTLDG
ncbi:MAG: rRNA ((1405)-N(7))-methyltransferase [Chloroflexota bacterium]|jgi:16S rRNA (guanine(1405)-N(7))-methyltransferase|nr:rRNA ((1405)-N(7))-methyltransferase [Chloroflexota bacterium]